MMSLKAQGPPERGPADHQDAAKVTDDAVSLPVTADIPRTAYLLRRPGPDRRWRIYIGMEPVARAVGRCILEGLTPEILTVRLDVIGIGVDLVDGDQHE